MLGTVKQEEESVYNFKEQLNQNQPLHLNFQLQNHPDNVRSMIDQIQEVANESQNMVAIARNLKRKVKGFHKEIQNITQNMLMNLELKLSTRISEGDQQSSPLKDESSRSTESSYGTGTMVSGFNQELEFFIDNQLNNLEFIKENMNKYKTHLQNLNEIEPPQLNLSREVYFKSQQMSQKFITLDKGIFYESMLCQLNERLIALNTKDQTHLLEIVTDTDGSQTFKIIKLFQERVRFILLHEDRLLCEGRVYNKQDNYQICVQNLGHEDISGALAITDQVLFLGHIAMVRFSLWRYNSNRKMYEMLQRKPIFVVPNKREAYFAHLMKKDFFNPELPNHLFMAFGPNSLFKVVLVADALEKSYKDRLYSNKKDMIIDYKGIESYQVDDTKKQILIVLFSMSVIILDVTNKANCALKQFDTKQDCLVLLNIFGNIQVTLNKKSIIGTYAVCDILDQGISGWLIESDGLRMIGQIKMPNTNTGEEKDSVFVLACDNKFRGSLVILQIYLC
ncbi:UNKNOWN [Stylonychia lemnae]|uniref:Uncharacterized protein n=1 Tax=Stylonychia lemnae TaxID=5949 RepID=A0A078A9N8_STYLE|nr:UNKNOWN [Stylonychia lemnae]|eukprot:CDW78596.1 UNKNOWN [Stylonychia lemnae]